MNYLFQIGLTLGLLGCLHCAQGLKLQRRLAPETELQAQRIEISRRWAAEAEAELEGLGAIDASVRLVEATATDFWGSTELGPTSLEALRIRVDDDAGGSPWHLDLNPHKPVRITDWHARLGNNLVQLETAIVYAQKIGSPRVLLPPCGIRTKRGDLLYHDVCELMELPSELELEVKQKNPVGTGAAEDRRLVNGSFFGDFDKRLPFELKQQVTLGEAQKALQTHVFGHLKSSMRDAIANHSGRDRRLTIHMRGGDVFHIAFVPPDHTQPPCAFYEYIINQGLPGGVSYNEVLIVTDPKRQNPCIKVVEEKFPALVTVQSSKLGEDVGAVLAAQNLVASRSSFSYELAKLSQSLRRLHIPDGQKTYYSTGWFRNGCLDGVDVHAYDFKYWYPPVLTVDLVEYMKNTTLSEVHEPVHVCAPAAL